MKIVICDNKHEIDCYEVHCTICALLHEIKRLKKEVERTKEIYSTYVNRY